MSHAIFQIHSGTANTESVQIVLSINPEPPSGITALSDVTFHCVIIPGLETGVVCQPPPIPKRTVDGRNPAPPEMYITLSIMVDSPYQLVSPGFLPSTVYTTCLTVQATEFRATSQEFAARLIQVSCAPIPCTSSIESQKDPLPFRTGKTTWVILKGK